MSTPLIVTVVEITSGLFVRAHRAPLPSAIEANEAAYDALSAIDAQAKSVIKACQDARQPLPRDRIRVYWSDDEYRSSVDFSMTLGHPPFKEIDYPDLPSMLEHIRNISWM